MSDSKPKLAGEDAVLLEMLKRAGVISATEASIAIGGRMPYTVLRMLIAEDVIVEHVHPFTRARTYSFTSEGRSIAEAVELRLFAAGLIELPDRSDRRTA